MKNFLSILLSCICCLALFACTQEKSEQKTENISKTDFTYTYSDSDGILVVSSLTFHCDINNLSFSIVYYGNGLLNSYKDKHEVGNVTANTTLTYTKAISVIEENIRGDFSYAEVSINSGTKTISKTTQNTPEEEPTYNTECSFSFLVYKYDTYPWTTMKLSITNNTSKTITELQDFRVEVDFGFSSNSSFYIPRIILKEPLAPNSKVDIHLKDGFNSTTSGLTSSNSPYSSSTYYKQSYKVIYS